MSKSDVRAAVEIAARKFRDRPIDPPPNFPRTVEGTEVRPGEWSPDLYGMPPDCPIEPLGMDGDVIYLMDALGQLAACEPSKMGQKFIQRLAGDRQHYLYWASPRLDSKGGVTSWRAEKASECFYHAAARRGLFSAVDRVRGRGAWIDRRGVLIWHSGDMLWRSDRRRKRRDGSSSLDPAETGFSDGYFYPRRPDILSPWPEPVGPDNNPAREILQALRGWNWERPAVDPVLFLGWMAAALLGGALPWRPTLFAVGDAAVGKSTLQALARAVLGDALLQSADTSAAGIYQRVQQDSLPVAIDELEAEADPRKAMAVVKLARLSASGAMMLRGGADHAGVEFRAQSAFFFSSINPPALEPADVSRMAILRLRRLDARASGSAAPTLDGETTGPRLLRRLIEDWPRFPAALEAYRSVLRGAGHDGRGQDTLGVLLACADLALGPELAEELGVPMIDDLGKWGEWLAPSTMLEYEDRAANWLGCLRHLLTSRVDAWRQGSQHTVGALLERLERAQNGGEFQSELTACKSMLAQAGLGIAVPGELADADDGFSLCVPNESQLVGSLFRDTKWAGAPGASVWKSALRQAPAELLVSGNNRRSINGVQVRCTIVRMGVFSKGDW